MLNGYTHATRSFHTPFVWSGAASLMELRILTDLVEQGDARIRFAVKLLFLLRDYVKPESAEYVELIGYGDRLFALERERVSCEGGEFSWRPFWATN